MKNLLNNFYNALPLEVQQLVTTLNKDGIRVGFIGGVVRDFILYSKISNDIDLELRSSSDINMSELSKKLKAQFNNEFGIITLDLNDISVELGLPRVESFTDKKNHKNFTFFNSFGYEKEFLRRDFTVNAILLEVFNDELCIIDPLNGIQDIESKVLRACSDDFSKDPVRMLRAFRFKLSNDFSFCSELEFIVRNMKYEDCSSFYILKEADKSTKPLSFLNEIGMIEAVNRASVYNDEIYSAKEALEKEPSLQNRIRILKELGLSVKNAIPLSGLFNRIEECHDLFKYFVKNNMSDKEISYILDYLNIDHSQYRFEDIQSFNIKFNSKELSKELKKAKYMRLLLKEALI